jgi:phosphoribosylaminoimidazole-succinocarboxamide synthase
MNLLYEGKAKKIFQGPEKNQYVMYFKDDATAFNNLKKATIETKGILNLKIATKIFEYLAKEGVPSHYIKSLNDREMLVKAVKIIPLEVVVRNISAGNLCKRLGLAEKMDLNPPLVEFFYKNDALGDPILTEDHIQLMKLASKDEVANLKSQALKINQLMRSFFDKLGIILVDFKIEFGKDEDGKLILADEISPDCCRLWDSKTLEIMDKDRFRKEMGGLTEAYQDVLGRIEGNQ